MCARKTRQRRWKRGLAPEQAKRSAGACPLFHRSTRQHAPEPAQKARQRRWKRGLAPEQAKRGRGLSPFPTERPPTGPKASIFLDSGVGTPMNPVPFPPKPSRFHNPLLPEPLDALDPKNPPSPQDPHKPTRSISDHTTGQNMRQASHKSLTEPPASRNTIVPSPFPEAPGAVPPASHPITLPSPNPPCAPTPTPTPTPRPSPRSTPPTSNPSATSSKPTAPPPPLTAPTAPNPPPPTPTSPSPSASLAPAQPPPTQITRRLRQSLDDSPFRRPGGCQGPSSPPENAHARSVL